MNIKERFYANLEMIREETEQKSKSKKKKKRSLPSMSREMERDKSIPNSLEAYRDRMYQARKKMLRKEEVEQLEELSDPTHMSYRAKARNQLDKMVNRLGSKMGSNTVNTKKMKNRAEGIKKSYKLQPKKN